MEFDILMQYYDTLRDQMNLIDGDKLLKQFCGAKLINLGGRMSVEYYYMFMINVPKLILTRLASYLLIGKIYLFYKGLRVLQILGSVTIHEMASKIESALNHLNGM